MPARKKLTNVYIYTEGQLNDCQVTFAWVPRHNGIEGNEIADELARKAVSTPMLGPELGIPVSLSNLNFFINKWKLEMFAKRQRKQSQ